MSDSIDELLGLTLTKIEREVTGAQDIDEVLFYVDRGAVYKMYHSQDCCEYVYLHDVCGDWDDLIGSPITQATAVSNAAEPDGHKNVTCDDETWTFYIISTVKGTVTLRWLGSSNGYYSEEVDFTLHAFNQGGNKVLPS